MVGGPQSGFILTDGRGSVLAETDLQGAPQVVEAADYEAWGEANQVKAGMSLPEHGYVGAERDPAFGFYTYGVRVYDPSLRRWFSPEPEWLTQGPIGLNPYQYANNNPVRFVDLDGRVVVLPGNSPGVIAAHERGMAGSDSYRTRFNTLNDRQDVVVYVAASEIPPIRRRIAPDGEVLGNCTAVAGETEFGLINVAIDVKAARGPDDLFRTLMHEFGHAERDMPEALALRDAARLPNGSQERQQLEKWAKDRSTDAHTDQEHHNVRKEAEKATREVLDSEAKKKVNDSPAAKKAVSP
jgi:RHS repeat-associated protein